MRATPPTLSSGATAALGSLTTSDRYIVNKIADNQAQIEVAYAMARALTDLGRGDEARRQADLARAPSDTLLGDVRALSLAQTNRAIARAADLQRQADQRRQTLWLLFFVAFTIGVLDRDLDRAHGGPAADPAHRRGRAVRRRRPAPGSAEPNADRARATLPRDGRHGRTAAQRRGRRWSARRARSATARPISRR